MKEKSHLQSVSSPSDTQQLCQTLPSLLTVWKERLKRLYIHDRRGDCNGLFTFLTKKKCLSCSFERSQDYGMVPEESNELIGPKKAPPRNLRLFLSSHV